jgi:Amt family ammonium transporter
MDKGPLFNGHGFGQLGLQVLVAGCYVAFTLAVSWILWSALGAMAGGLRVEEHEELAGLDVSEHGMKPDPDFAAASTK